MAVNSEQSQTHAPEAPLVSVVVPFYNVRECVGYCMGSLLAQTFEAPYEVVCVDDGSTDGTGELLDTYADDPRVVVLHKENGGLSDARNHGVERARADLVTFVDGDDVVAPSYLEALYRARKSAESDVSLCLHKFVAQAAAPTATWEDCAVINVTCCEREEAVRRTLRCNPSVSAWARLAPRDTYVEHPFPKGKVYEDEWSVGDHFFQFDRFVFVEAPLYGYVQRQNSIAHSLSASESKLRDYVEAVSRMDDASLVMVAADDPDLMFHRALDASRLWRLAANVNPRTTYAKRVMTETRTYIKSALTQLVSDPNTGGQRLRFLALAATPWAYEPLIRLYEWAVRGWRNRS